MDNKSVFATIQFLRDLIRTIRFYTATLPNDVMPNDKWDKIRRNFSEVDSLLSEAQGKTLNGDKTNETD